MCTLYARSRTQTHTLFIQLNENGLKAVVHESIIIIEPLKGAIECLLFLYVPYRKFFDNANNDKKNKNYATRCGFAVCFCIVRSLHLAVDFVILYRMQSHIAYFYPLYILY